MINPFLGVFFHWLGGLASGSFYVPFRGVRLWSWETAWLVGGVFSWIIAPWLMGSLLSNDLIPVLRESLAQHGNAVFWAYLFGVLWGMGGLTFGLTMRYLGMSLGMAVALGYCSTFGTLIPPLFNGEFHAKLIAPLSGNWILAGIVVCAVGIAIAGLAGMRKEREMSAEDKKKSVKEFNFWKGIGVATFSGIMSACFSFGLAAGAPITAISVQGHGTAAHWGGLPVLVVILAGGFTTNVIWCIILNLRNGSGHEYFSSDSRGRHAEGAVLGEHGATAGQTADKPTPPAPRNYFFRGLSRRLRSTNGDVPLLRNYFFSGLAGVVWYFQFFFYTIGESMMGNYKFSSWTLHMASIIIFSSLWGIGLGEWRGASRRSFGLLLVALATLLLATVVVGYGNYIGQADVTGGH